MEVEVQTQGNESNGKILVLSPDGETIFSGRRTVREIENDGITKSGKVTVQGREYRVFHSNWLWTGSQNDYN